MKNNNITIAKAQELLGGVVGLKDNAVVIQAGNTGDVESLTSPMDVDVLSGMDVESVNVGMGGAVAATIVAESISAQIPFESVEENVTLIPDVESANDLATSDLDLEYFDGRSPNLLQPFAFALAANTMVDDEGLSLMYPTVNIPSNVEGVMLSLVYGKTKTKFKRDNVGLTGQTRLNSQSVLTGLRNPSIVRSDANMLVPVFNDTNKVHLDEDFKNDAYIHPTTGEKISTAPIKFGPKFDLTTISHTSKLVSEGVFGDETSLDVGGHIEAVYGSIGDDKFKFDIATLPMNEITGGPSGDAQDLMVNISTENFVIDPAKIKQFDGTVSAELGAIPAGLSLVYGLDINGSGNMETCDFGIRTPTIVLLKVIDADGNDVDTEAGDGAAAVAVGEKLELTSYDLKQTVTNADLRVIANVIDVGEIGQRIGIPYGAVDSYEKTIISDARPARADALLSIATIRSITRSKDLKVKAVKETIRSIGTDVNGGRTKTITSTAINAYYREEALDLANMLDAEEHGKREADIAGLLAVKIKAILPAILYDTNYAALSKAYGRNTPGIGITFGTDLIPFMPETIEINGVTVKLAMTTVEEFRSDIFVFPIDAEHNPSSKVMVPLNLGVKITKPDIVVTGTFNKISGTFVVPRTRVVNTCSILHRFKVSQIDAALSKITSKTSA